MKCGKCGAKHLKPAPRDDGLPGILYHTCNNCGWSRAVTARPRKVRIKEAK